MPICNKPALTPSQAKSATECDDHASEAAKMKRTREQAYFNSYNFDAIQVLPPDNDVEAREETVQKVGSVCRPPAALGANSATTKVPSSVAGGASQNQPPHNALKKMYRGASSFASSPSNRSRGSLHSSSGHSSGHGSQRSGNSSEAGGYLRRQHSGELTYTYMQRFGAHSVRSRNPSPSADLERAGSAAVAIQAASGAGVKVASEEIAPVHGKCATEVSENGSFLLPRAMLKYQSAGNANSMPLAVSSSGRADKLLPNGHNHQQSINSNNNNSHNDINSGSSSSSGKTMMVMTTNAISNKHTPYNNSNNNNHNSSNKQSNAAPSTVSTKAIHNSNSSNNNNNSNSNRNITKNKHSDFRVATATKTAAAATAQATTTSAPGAAVRVKKQSTSSTITTTTASSSVSAEHDEAAAAVAAAATTTTRANNAKVTTSKTSNSKLAQSGGSERRGRTSSHQSHYSTDKSGSSGYYSSNVCSTYSLDEHIYCEPVIDILDVSVAGASAVAAAGKISKSARLDCSSQTADGGGGGGGGEKNTDSGPLTSAPTGTTTSVHSHVRDMSSKGGASKRCFGRRNGAAATTSRNGESGIAGCSDMDGGDECDGEEDEAVTATVERHSGTIGKNSKAVAETTFGASKVPANLQFLLQRQTSEDNSQSQHFSDNLRILETSIENLDRHLKNVPSLSSHERIAAFVQTQHHHHHHAYHLQMPPTEIGCDKLAMRVPQNPHHYLPTIMEGYDPTNQPHRSWPDEMVDDSLLDIDLDSFLLVNERKAGGKFHKLPLRDGGIDNPTFLTEEQEEENNYKCAKYINSCPDDAYRVESDIAAGTGTVSEKSLSVADHHMKRYEDQLHFQSTRELLEDVRDKIRLLSQVSGSGSAGSHSPDVHLNRGTPTEQLPHELEDMIKMLKGELENYLNRMNQHSELEIRQLCSGLVRNHNIVKMKKAFERRRSTHSLGTADSDYGYSGNYEAICDGVPVSIREQIASIRCASDPNFKMKRKSLSEVFPVADCYAESEALQRVTSQVSQLQRRPSLPHRDRNCADQRQREHDQNVITLHVPTTQLQRNLSYQQPVLNKLDAKALVAVSIDAEVVGKGNAVGGSSASGSGVDTGESGDKDSILEWHRKKPSIWEMYYGTNRMNQSLLGKRNGLVTNNNNQVTMSYPSSRPESDFTLDLPRAEQLRIKMDKEKKFRQRCRYITTFLSLVFFLLTVVVVSLVLTRGKRMFGSMI